MSKRDPESVITDWCDFHLDEATSRWPSDGWMHEDIPDRERYVPVYAGEGIVAALKKAGYEIVDKS